MRSLWYRLVSVLCDDTIQTRRTCRPKSCYQSRKRVFSLECLEQKNLLSVGGQDLSDIINGTPTDDYPTVGIVGHDQGGFCTGTLISPNHVLTAAHCAELVSNINGSFQLGGTTYGTSEVVIHPSWNPNQFGTDNANDIAIYVLSSAVTGITPSNIFRGTEQVGQELILVGYGAGGNGDSGHNGDFGTKRVGTTSIDHISDTLIHWHFDDNSESNTAPGDSGGPAFIDVNGDLQVAGITSGGDRYDAGIGDNSYDTRVRAYADWIDSIVDSGGGGGSSDDHADAPGEVATEITLDENGVGAGTGNMEEAGDRDVFQFTVNKGGSATINLTGTDSQPVDTYLRFYDSSGTLIALDDDGGIGLNSSLTQTLTAGTYYVSAGSYNDAGTGNFRVDVEFAADTSGDDHVNDPGSGATLITLDDNGVGSGTGNMEDAGDRDVFQFTVDTSGLATISLTGTDTSPVDTYLRFYDSSGTLIAENDDGDADLNSSLTQTLTSGTYYVSAGSYNDAGTGDYRVDIVFTADTFSEEQVYYFSTLTAGALENSDGTTLTVDDSDIVKLTVSDSSYVHELYFDGSDVGLRSGSEDVNAFTILDNGNIVMSTNKSFSVPTSGGTLKGTGHSLLLFIPDTLGSSTTGTWEIYLDGLSSDVGLTRRGERIDAVAVRTDGTILVSMIGNGYVPGISNKVRDEDIIAFTPTSLGFGSTGSWELVLDGSDIGLSAGTEDIYGLSVLEPAGENDLPEFYLTTKGTFSVAGLSGSGNDIFNFIPSTLGGSSSGSFSSPLELAGADHGITPVIDGLHIGSMAQAGEDFQIDIRFLDNGLTDSQQVIAQQAADRWAEVIIGDVPDVGSIDDLLIDIEAPFIDGSGGILGGAAPIDLRSGSLLPYTGFIGMDSADVADLESDGGLFDVFLHEMGHVLGIGTLWSDLGLLVDAGSSDPVFVGANAVREYTDIFGLDELTSVPVANTGGGGTRDAHWRELDLDNEIMTGYLNSGSNYLSRITVGSLADIGYEVDWSAADDYQAPGRVARLAADKTGDAVMAKPTSTNLVSELSGPEGTAQARPQVDSQQPNVDFLVDNNRHASRIDCVLQEFSTGRFNLGNDQTSESRFDAVLILKKQAISERIALDRIFELARIG